MRLMHKIFGQFPCVFAVILTAIVVTGCVSDSPPNGPGAMGAGGTNETVFREPFSAGDSITVDLNAGTPIPIPTITTTIKNDGTISLPDVGRVVAAGKTPAELEVEIRGLYVPAFYKTMNVTVTSYMRSYYVLGEVNQPGKQQFTGALTVTQGVSAAGGFTPFAKKTKVTLRRANGKVETVNCVKAIEHPEVDKAVSPGDTIFVPRRFW